MNHRYGNRLVILANRYVLAIGLGVLVGLATPRIAGAQTNLIVDGSFELVEVSQPPHGWQMTKSQDGNSTLRGVEMPVKSGKRALLLQGRGSWMSANALPMEINPANT